MVALNRVNRFSIGWLPVCKLMKTSEPALHNLNRDKLIGCQIIWLICACVGLSQCGRLSWAKRGELSATGLRGYLHPIHSQCQIALTCCR